MRARVRSKVIECLTAFLQRRSHASDQEIDSLVRALPALRARAARVPAGDDRSRPFVLADADSIAAPESVRSAMQRAPGAPPIPFPENAVAACDLPAGEVYKRIAHLIDHVSEQIRRGETPSVDVPDLHSSNAIHDEKGHVFLGSKVRRVSLHDTMEFMRILLTLELAFEIIQRGPRATKRGLYYHHQSKLPDKRSGQLDSDRALAALSNILRVRRSALGFAAARKGSVSGSLVIREGEQVVDISRFGRQGGWSIPGLADAVEIVNSEAAFILVVEKDTIAARLVHGGWCETHPCVLVCSGGFPSLGARELTRRLIETLRVPAYLLADGDAPGIRVGLTFAHGALSTGMETPWLACEGIRWAGLYPSDVERFGISKSFQISLTPEDFESAKLLLDHPSQAYVKGRVRRELETLNERGTKVELDALSCSDYESFAREYLPRKLFEAELVKL